MDIVRQDIEAAIEPNYRDMSDSDYRDVVIGRSQKRWGIQSLSEEERRLAERVYADASIRNVSMHNTSKYAFLCDIVLSVNVQELWNINSGAEEYGTLCERAVMIEPSAIKHIKPNAVPASIYKKLCLRAVQYNNELLSYCSDPDDEICQFVIEKAPLAIRHLSTKNQTTKLCMMAIKKNPRALHGIVVLTLELCVEAIRGDKFVLCGKRFTADVCLNIIPELVAEFGSDILGIGNELYHTECSRDVQDQIRLGIVRAAADGKAILCFRRPPPQLCVEAYRTSPNAIDYIVDFVNCRAVAKAAAVDKLAPLAPAILAASLQAEVILSLFEKRPARADVSEKDWHHCVYNVGWHVGRNINLLRATNSQTA